MAPIPLIRSPRRMAALAAAHPSALLLAAQLMSLLVYPAMDDTHDGRVLFGAVALVVVPLTAWAIPHTRSTNRIAWALAIPAIALSLASIALDQPVLAATSSALESALYFYAAAALIHYMLEDYRVSVDELFAAAATFTLLAWGFAYAYLVCQALYPGSFTGMVEPDRQRRWIELLFLSFSTLSGTGNGDIMPISAQARALVMLQQFAGVGYIAAVVGRVIGMTLIRARIRGKR